MLAYYTRRPGSERAELYGIAIERCIFKRFDHRIHIELDTVLAEPGVGVERAHAAIKCLSGLCIVADVVQIRLKCNDSVAKRKE